MGTKTVTFCIEFHFGKYAAHDSAAYCTLFFFRVQLQEELEVTTNDRDNFDDDDDDDDNNK